jgi:hypothetical protein
MPVLEFDDFAVVLTKKIITLEQDFPKNFCGFVTWYLRFCDARCVHELSAHSECRGNCTNILPLFFIQNYLALMCAY